MKTQQIKMIWKLRTKTLPLDHPVWMGIVNITPDSFSDGGKFTAPVPAVDHALRLIDDGAEIIDLGGESTRPGSEGVSAEEELRRILPVLRQLRKCRPDILISVDTVKSSVAGEVLEAGADMINDVSGVSDPDMVSVLCKTGAGYCLMHTQGVPKTMQDNPRYEDVVSEVFTFLKNRRQMMIDAGVSPETIAVDPGLGFGKTSAHNWQLIDNIVCFHRLAAPILVGHSRKRFIAERFAERDEGTRLISRQLVESGVHILRVHEVCGHFAATARQ
ncbi:MAG: dihydropteroate synthase [Planctomycetaceae bacterium]|nr:dihydropteroate synthase [Planctomycetaceae bacterium]